MAAVSDSPAWRSLRRRRAAGGPAARSLTSSSDFQVAVQRLQTRERVVTAPVDGLASWGLHVAGLPSHADVRRLRRQLAEVQRELLALRRELAERERERARTAMSPVALPGLGRRPRHQA